MTKKELIEEMAKVIDDRLLEARNYLGSMNKGEGYWIAQKLVEHYQPKIPEGSVVLSKEEYEGKEIAVEMSGGHKLRLTVGKFGEMSRVLEESTRKETAKEILQELWYSKLETTIEVSSKHNKEDIKIACQAVVDLIREKIQELAKQFGVEVEE